MVWALSFASKDCCSTNQMWPPSLLTPDKRALSLYYRVSSLRQRALYLRKRATDFCNSTQIIAAAATPANVVTFATHDRQKSPLSLSFYCIYTDFDIYMFTYKCTYAYLQKSPHALSFSVYTQIYIYTSTCTRIYLQKGPMSPQKSP